LTLVVAIAGLLMGGGVWSYRMWRLSRYYASVGQEKKIGERMYRYGAAVYSGYAEMDEESARRSASQAIDARLPKNVREHEKQSAVTEEQNANGAREIAKGYASLADEYSAVARKYERAARYPWLPVEPDPPEP
jgi:hypothetical protein